MIIRIYVYGLYHCMNARKSAFQHFGLTLESGHIELARSEWLDGSFMEICWCLLIFASRLEQLTCLLGYQGTVEVQLLVYAGGFSPIHRDSSGGIYMTCLILPSNLQVLGIQYH